MAIEPGDSCLFRPWGVEYAHVDCDWLRPEEKSVHELQGAELNEIFWEYACSHCGHDVVTRQKPDAGVTLVCPGGCKPYFREACHG
jgi:hypothetical protein